jgi:predicted nucleic acid-binding protein
VNGFVFNTSPLILFVKAGLGPLLPKLSQSIVVPRGVFEELGAHRDDGVHDFVRGHESFKVVDVVEYDPRVAAWDLGRGETEVISYAMQNVDFVPVIDDAEARACGVSLGLATRGTGSLLILAKERKLIDSVREVLISMRSQGFWISNEVVELLSLRAGESVKG